MFRFVPCRENGSRGGLFATPNGFIPVARGFQSGFDAGDRVFPPPRPPRTAYLCAVTKTADNLTEFSKNIDMYFFYGVY
jgi:hypothetical protein